MGKNDSKKQRSVYENLLKQREQIYRKGTKPIIGIDIGSSYIKVVKMKKNNKIAKFAFAPLPEGVIAQGRIEAKELLVDTLRKILKKNSISGKECAICITGNEIIVRELTMPEMEEKQIMDNIRHELTSFLPNGCDDYSIDYKILEYIRSESGGTGSLRVLAAAVPNQQARAYVDTMKQADLTVKYIDVIPNIDSKLARWVMHAIGREVIKDVALIDFGSHTTDVTIIQQGSYCMHKTISNGGDYLTTIIADKSEMDFNDAEEYKFKTNFFMSDENDILVQQVLNHFDYLMMDIDRILEFYKTRNEQKGIDQIYVMGGGSLLKGLSGYIERRLGVKVFPLSEALEMFRGGRNQTENLALMFHAIGATMREEC